MMNRREREREWFVSECEEKTVEGPKQIITTGNDFLFDNFDGLEDIIRCIAITVIPMSQTCRRKGPWPKPILSFSMDPIFSRQSAHLQN